MFEDAKKISLSERDRLRMRNEIYAHMAENPARAPFFVRISGKVSEFLAAPAEHAPGFRFVGAAFVIVAAGAKCIAFLGPQAHPWIGIPDRERPAMSPPHPVRGASDRRLDGIPNRPRLRSVADNLGCLFDRHGHFFGFQESFEAIQRSLPHSTQKGGANSET